MDAGHTRTHGPPEPSRGPGARERMVHSAAALIARDGLRGTGMREVADHAHAPRGSIRHYFPGGKDQLTLEALTWIGTFVRAELDAAAGVGGQPGKPASAVAVLDRFVAMWHHGLIETDVTTGCSVAAVVHDTDDQGLLAHAAEVFASWREPFRRALVANRVAVERADALATTAVAALEGAVILSRARRECTALLEAAQVLRELITAAEDPPPHPPDDPQPTSSSTRAELRGASRTL